MQSIGKINPGLALAERNKPATSLVPASQTTLPNDSVVELATLLDQARAAFPNQTMPPETGKIYMQGLEAMTLKFGLDSVRQSLWKAVMGSEWLPTLAAIETLCRMAQADNRRRDDAQAVIRAHDADKARWEAERAEDLAAGIPRGADAKVESERFLQRETRRAVESASEKTADKRTPDTDAESARKYDLAAELRAQFAQQQATA